MHSELSWLYPMASVKSGFGLWKEQLGWLWTDTQLYPFLYQNTSAGWLYFYGASQGKSSSTITLMNAGSSRARQQAIFNNLHSN
jgi:hypothetical protein